MRLFMLAGSFRPYIFYVYSLGRVNNMEFYSYSGASTARCIFVAMSPPVFSDCLPARQGIKLYGASSGQFAGEEPWVVMYLVVLRRYLRVAEMASMARTRHRVASA